MRAVYLVILFFLIAGVSWALQIPLSSLAVVHDFSSHDMDLAASELALERAGSGSSMALQRGLNSDSLEVRLRCARLMALRGERSGDRYLFEMLQTHSEINDPLGAMAETFLLSVWDQRDAPRPAERDKLVRPRGKGTDAESMEALNDLLEKFPTWVSGYVQRARLYLRNGEGLETKRQALMALAVEPDNFEAIVVLGQAYLLLEAPEQAGLCLQQALRLNPRLKHELREDIRETLKAIDIERARRRRDRRKEAPVI